MRKGHHANKNIKNVVALLTGLFIISWLAIAAFSFLYVNARLSYTKLKNDVVFLERNINFLQNDVKKLSRAGAGKEDQLLGFLQWQFILKDQVDRTSQQFSERISRAKDANKDKALLNLLYYNLALTHMMAVDFEKAIGTFEEALKYDPKDAASCYNLGLLYSVSRRDNTTAVKYYKKYLELVPGGAKAEEVRAKLEELKEGGAG